MKKIAASVLLAAVLVSGLCSCGTEKHAEGLSPVKSSDKTASSEKILSVEVGPNPETLDPAINATANAGCLLHHLFEPLLFVGVGDEINPGQAESYEVSEDGLTWTFHLREGLKWSDGTPLTAEDFVYSWRRVCDPEVAAPYSDMMLSMVKGYGEAMAGRPEALCVAAPDDRTFVVTLSNFCPYYEDIVAFNTLCPVKSGSVEKNGDAWAVNPETYISNGAFYLEEWVPDSYILLRKNPYYWNASAVKLDGIRFNLIGQANTAYIGYLTGELQVIESVPRDERRRLKGRSDLYTSTSMGTYFVEINNNKEKFSDSRVRKALSLAIDREYLCGTILDDTVKPAWNIVGPGWTDADGTEFIDRANGGQTCISKDYAANLAEAKRLMAEAGYPGGAGFPTVTYTTTDGSSNRVLAEYLQQVWKTELGVETDVNMVEGQSFNAVKISGNYDIAFGGWIADYSDASNMLEIFYSGSGNNTVNYNNPDYDGCVEAARFLQSNEERSKALHRAEDILIEDAGTIPVFYAASVYMMSDRVTGVWQSAYGTKLFTYADIQE